MKRELTMFWSFVGALLLLIAVAHVSVGVADAANPAPTPKEIKLGGLFPLSGPGAPWGLALIWGIEFAVEDVNKGGGLTVEGQKYLIKFYPEDDEYKGTVGLTKCKKLMDQVGVNLAIFSNASAIVLATQPITEPARVIQVVGAQGDVCGYNKPYTFRAVNFNQMQIEACLRYIQENYPKAKTMAIVDPNDASGWGSTKNAARVALKRGYKILFQEYYERGTQDFSPLVTKILATKPDIICTGNSPPGDAALMVKTAHEMDYKGVWTACAPPDANTLLKIAGPKATQNFVLAQEDATSPLAPEKLRKLYDRCMKERGQWLAIVGWGYRMAEDLFGAIKEANSVKSEKVRDGFTRMRIETIVGPAHFGRPYGTQEYAPVPLSVIKDGKVHFLKFVAPAEITEADVEWQFDRKEVIGK